MTLTRYRGFRILARPYQLCASGQWSVSLEIQRRGRRQSFSTTEQCRTRDEAVARCSVWGRRIIDGGVPGWSVDRLRGTSQGWPILTRLLARAVRRSPFSAS